MNYIFDRLREPSTYAGIAAFLAAFGVHVTGQAWWEYIVQLGMAAAGLLAIVLPEVGRQGVTTENPRLPRSEAKA